MDKQFNIIISSNTRAVGVDPDMATALVTIQNSKINSYFSLKYQFYRYFPVCI